MEKKTFLLGNLFFDEHNLRLLENPGVGDTPFVPIDGNDEEQKLNYTKFYWNYTNTTFLVEDILDGSYIAQPMLGIMENGKVIVVDGNRRLAAMLIAHDQNIWDSVDRRNIIAQKKPLNNDGWVTHEIYIFDDREEIHKKRIKHQTHTNTMWTGKTTAYDLRKMSNEGKTVDDIKKFYKLDAYRIYSDIFTLNVLEQINANVNFPWTKGYHFARLRQALRHENINKHLKLPQYYNSVGNRNEKLLAKKPLKKDMIFEAVNLMYWLCGSTFDSKEHIDPKTRDETQIGYLNDIYGNPEALEKLKSSKDRSVRDIRNWMYEHEDHWEVKRNLEIIHGFAVRKLKELKDEREDLVPNANGIHIAHASYSIYNDQSSQFLINVHTRDVEKYGDAIKEIENYLKECGFSECKVEVV